MTADCREGWGWDDMRWRRVEVRSPQQWRPTKQTLVLEDSIVWDKWIYS